MGASSGRAAFAVDSIREIRAKNSSGKFERAAPRPSAFAVNPKHRDVECGGGRVSVRDPEAARPSELGIHLLRFLRGQSEFAWATPTALDDLVGTSRLRGALDAGESVTQILATDAAAIEKFRRDRVKFLLY